MWKLAVYVALVAAFAAALGLSGATDARASSYAHTVVSWGGTDCITTTGAQEFNRYRLSVPTWQCSPFHTLVWDEGALPGAWIGVDPIMGDATWISCSIDDGWNTYTDFARAGDGTDVSCLRVAN